MLLNSYSSRTIRLVFAVSSVLFLVITYRSTLSKADADTTWRKTLHRFADFRTDKTPEIETVTVTSTLTKTVMAPAAIATATTMPFTLTQNPIQVSYDNEKGKYDFVVFGLHSLGSEGDGIRGAYYLHKGWKGMDEWWKRAKWVWPSAYKGKAHSWYQITHKFSPVTPEDVEAFEEDESHIMYTSGQVKDLINFELQKGIPPENIFLFGFSQGCVMSLFTALTVSVPLGGVYGLNGYLPMRKKFEKFFQPITVNTPVVLVGGSKDGIIAGKWTQQSAEYLQTNLSMPNVEFQMREDGVHRFYMAQYVAIGDWLIEKFRALDAKKAAREAAE